MNYLLIHGYEILSAFIPFLIVFVLCRNMRKRQGIPPDRSASPVILIFSFYVIGVYYLTGAGTLYDGFLYQLEFRPDQLNVVPFSNGMDITSYFNILLFVPFGFLIPLIGKQMDRIIPVLGIGFLFTTLIELSQFLNNRRTDIDDILLNLIGTVIGFGLYRAIGKHQKHHASHISFVELSLYILVMFLGRFLLFNEMGIARLIYGF